MTGSTSQMSIFDMTPAPTPAPASTLLVVPTLRTPDPHDPFERGRQDFRDGKECSIPGGLRDERAWAAWQDGWLFEQSKNGSVS